MLTYIIQKGSLQHPRARGDELPDLHVRLDQRRPARHVSGRARTSRSSSFHSIEHSKNLDRPIVVRYGYWVKDAVTNQFGTTLFGQRKICAGSEAGDGTHAAVRLDRRSFSPSSSASRSASIRRLRQYSAFDYATTTISFVGFATPVFWLAPDVAGGGRRTSS